MGNINRYKQGLRRTRKLRQCTNWKVNLRICRLAKASSKKNWSVQLVCPAGPSNWSVQLVCPARWLPGGKHSIYISMNSSFDFCYFHLIKFLPVTRNFFLGQEISNCDMKFLHVTRSFFLWPEISLNGKTFLPVTGHYCLWQEISSSHKKLLLVAKNFFLLQEISALEKRYLSVTRNFFPWQLNVCSSKMLLPVTRKYFLHVVCDRKNSFIGQEIQKYLKSNSHQNSVNCCQNLLPLTRNFFLWQIFFLMTKNVCPWKEISFLSLQAKSYLEVDFVFPLPQQERQEEQELSPKSIRRGCTRSLKFDT